MKGEKKMPKNLPDIIYDKSNITPIVDANTSYYHVPFYKDAEYFTNYESYVSFVKGCERLVRTNDRYNKYIAYLKREVKLDHCQVFKNITDEDADIEMHHGPIFTLFDYCAIVLEYFLLKKWKITTARVADVVLDEHQKNRIQIVMVSSTVHEEIHNGQIFINQNQAYGDLQAFINKYRMALSDEYIEMINRYVDKSLIYDSNDFGVLELNKNLIKK
jgi:hypothetical protein